MLDQDNNPELNYCWLTTEQLTLFKIYIERIVDRFKIPETPFVQ